MSNQYLSEFQIIGSSIKSLKIRNDFVSLSDVDNIKREDFKHPERQDEYGTSVISIQFSKEHGNSLAIINRYNHRNWKNRKNIR